MSKVNVWNTLTTRNYNRLRKQMLAKGWNDDEPVSSEAGSILEQSRLPEDKVADVVPSSRPTDSLSCLVNPGPNERNLERVL